MKLFILITLYFICNEVICQNAYYDAHFLSSKVKHSMQTLQFEIIDDEDGVFGILDKYIEPNKRNTKQEVFYALRDNPFIKFEPKKYSQSLCKEVTTKNAFYNNNIFHQGDITFEIKNLSGYSFDTTINTNGVISKIFEFVQNKIEFSEKHLKFLKIFKDDFATDSSLRILFPRTTNILDLLDGDMYELNSYYNHLRIAFYDDFNNLNASVNTYIFTPYFEKIIVAKKDFSASKDATLQPLKAGFYLTKILAYNDNPADVLSSLVNNDFDQDPLKEALSIIGVFSESLRSIDSNALWVNEIELTGLLSSENQYNIYLGLVYQQIKNTSYGATSYFVENSNPEALVKIKSKQFDIIHKKQGVHQFYKEIYQKNLNNLENRREYFFRLHEVLIDYFDLLSLINPNNNSRKYFESYISFSGYINDIYLTTNAKKYLEATTLIAALLNDPKTESVMSENAAKSILKYGGFMAAFVDANNPHDINVALDRYIFPVRIPKSYVKRSTSSISLTSYVGLFSGYRFGGDSSNYRVSAGITIPVGLNFSVAVSKDTKKKIAFFVPVIDIGGLNVLNFKKDSIAVSTLTIENLFSPGLHFLYNRAFNLPLTFMFGVQRSPISFSNSKGEVTDGSFRLRLALTFEIPLYTIYAHHVD